jgi:GNAT superfamily N-acetyltransferase
MMKIRLALPAERDALEDLQRRASLANDNDRPHIEANPDVIELPVEQIDRGEVFVAEIDGAIAGFSAILQEDDHVELDGLFVEPDRWRQGIGAQLVDMAVREAHRRGKALMVVANPHALDFYFRCGFSEEGVVATRFGPGIRMSR